MSQSYSKSYRIATFSYVIDAFLDAILLLIYFLKLLQYITILSCGYLRLVDIPRSSCFFLSEKNIGMFVDRKFFQRECHLH